MQGQPVIDAVLPAFHAFVRDTRRVARNAAFDMRFLQLKNASTGLRFDQPVLDTPLEAAGIRTLGAAMAASQATHLARVSY